MEKTPWRANPYRPGSRNQSPPRGQALLAWLEYVSYLIGVHRHNHCGNSGCLLNFTELYKRAIDGDPSARQELYGQLYVSFRIIARHRIRDWNDAEEAVQAAVVKVTSKLDQVADPQRFPAWAHMILKNEIIDYYRGTQTRRVHEVELDAGETPHNYQVADPDLKMRLKECLKKVNAVFAKHARILNLRYQGYGTQEICARLAITPNNLHVILSRARALLKNCLETGDIKP